MKEIVKFIEEFEGFVANMYIDIAGHKTIGIGTLWFDGMPLKVTRQEAEAYCVEDCEKIIDDLNRIVKVPLNHNQRIALVSFIYNLGIGNFKSSTLLKKLQTKDYEGAANELLKWDKATVNGKKVSVKGLTRRRQAERAKFLEETQLAGNV